LDGLNDALIVRMDDEMFVMMALHYRMKEAELNGNKFGPTNVTTTGFPTIDELNRLPMTIENDSNAPVHGGVNPKADW
jgi:hypothetical protein